MSGAQGPRVTAVHGTLRRALRATLSAALLGTFPAAVGCGSDPFAQSCQEFCDFAVACAAECPDDEPRCAGLSFGEHGATQCLSACTHTYGDYPNPCRLAAIEYHVCVAGLTCDEFRGDGFSACAEASAAVLAACPEVAPATAPSLAD